jgi:hypothetical protein
VTSTLLNLFVLPSLYLRFAKPAEQPVRGDVAPPAVTQSAAPTGVG